MLHAGLAAALSLLLLAGCAPAERAPEAPAGEAGVSQESRSRVLESLPAPDARAAAEDLPPGFTCRIGSDRLATVRNYGLVLFPAPDRLYLEGLGRWRVADALSGATLEEFELALTSGVSPSGTCMSTEASGEVALLRMPGREPVSKRPLPSTREVIPADDCHSAIQLQGSGSACVSLFGDGLRAEGELCAGTELATAAVSGDGRRAALAPSRTRDSEYRGDGIHVFDVASRQEVAFVARTGEYLGEVALSRDGGLVAFVDGDQTRLVAAPSGAAVSSFKPPAGARVSSLVFSPSAQRLGLVLERSQPTQEYGLAILDVASGRPLFTQWGLPYVGRLAFSPDGARVAHSADSGVRVIDASTGEDLVAPGRLYRIEASALSPGGDRAVVSSAGHLTIWDTRDCTRVAALPNRPALVELAVLPDAANAMGIEDHRLCRVDLRTGARACSDTRIAAFWTLSVDGRHVYAGSFGDDRQTHVVRIDAASMKEDWRASIPKLGPLGTLIVVPDGKTLYAVAPGGLEHGDSPTGATSVVEIDAATGALGRRFTSPGRYQTYVGAALEHGRVLVVNDARHERGTGKELPRVEPGLVDSSGDHGTALWSWKDGVFAWPTDQPLPASPVAGPLRYLSTAVGRAAVLQCSGQSCLVTRVVPQ
ncbi:hypothetical protein [Nannocystis bainbridge]|uniref:Uncharacterized protein n=1 Tax=Nannocystis bainbridge TaxID=2995303 RepID=A0ABT5E9T4_9BACT|nr:hypothetical protein [Nannocystis bainbridge]MDC0721637.1 hypothetical protein [Nannocystis bainbridge]